MTHDPFPDAPAGSYVSSEGWLIVRNEAFTEAEWREHLMAAANRRVRARKPITEKARATRRRWYAANREKMRAYHREHKRQAAYRAMSLDQINASIDRWQSIVDGLKAEKKRRVMADLRKQRAA